MRSTRSTSALGLIPTNVSHSATHRAIKGHRTHGSQTALSFLSGGYTPSSPHRIPRAAEEPLDLIQSAPVVGVGLLADDDSHSSHGSHALLGSMNSPQKAWGRGRGCCDNSEALAGLRSVLSCACNKQLHVSTADLQSLSCGLVSHALHACKVAEMLVLGM